MPRTPAPPATDAVDALALQWLQRRHAGAWDERDQAALDAWLAADPAHARAWARAQHLWDELAPLGDRACERLARRRLARGHVARSDRQAPAPALPTPPKPPRRALARPAGRLVLAGLALTALGGLLVHALPGAWDDEQLLQTAAGERLSVALPDGSRVELAPHTRLQVQTSLACRCFTLQAGEVVFSAAHGDPRPLRVSAGLATVQDIGTVFWTRRDADGVAVAVDEGEVEAWVGHPERPGNLRTRLQAGQTWAVGPHGQALAAPFDPSGDLMAWRRGEIVLRDAPLAQVLRELQRHHPGLRLELDQRLAGYHLSGRLAADDLDAAWRLIEQAYPARVQRLSADQVRIEFQGR